MVMPVPVAAKTSVLAMTAARLTGRGTGGEGAGEECDAGPSVPPASSTSPATAFPVEEAGAEGAEGSAVGGAGGAGARAALAGGGPPPAKAASAAVLAVARFGRGAGGV